MSALPYPPAEPRPSQTPTPAGPLPGPAHGKTPPAHSLTGLSSPAPLTYSSYGPWPPPELRLDNTTLLGDPWPVILLQNSQYTTRSALAAGLRRGPVLHLGLTPTLLYISCSGQERRDLLSCSVETELLERRSVDEPRPSGGRGSGQLGRSGDAEG